MVLSLPGMALDLAMEAMRVSLPGRFMQRAEPHDDGSVFIYDGTLHHPRGPSFNWRNGMSRCHSLGERSSPDKSSVPSFPRVRMVGGVLPSVDVAQDSGQPDESKKR